MGEEEAGFICMYVCVWVCPGEGREGRPLACCVYVCLCMRGGKGWVCVFLLLLALLGDGCACCCWSYFLRLCCCTSVLILRWFRLWFLDKEEVIGEGDTGGAGMEAGPEALLGLGMMVLDFLEDLGAAAAAAAAGTGGGGQGAASVSVVGGSKGKKFENILGCGCVNV